MDFLWSARERQVEVMVQNDVYLPAQRATRDPCLSAPTFRCFPKSTSLCFMVILPNGMARAFAGFVSAVWCSEENKNKPCALWCLAHR
jgi:hypothetical protein